MKTRSSHYLIYLLAGLVLLSGFLPFPAFAAGDLITTSTKVAGQALSIPKLIAFISYVAGTAFAVRGLFALKGFIEKPDDNPINVFIGFATISALLILLPYSMGVTANSVGLLKAEKINSTASHFAATPECKADNTLNKVFCGLVVQFSPFAKFLAVIAYVMAIALLLTGLLNLKAYGEDPSQTPLRSILIKFVLAAMLVSLPMAMQIFVTSVTGVSSIDTKVTIKQPKSFKGSIK